MTPEQLSELAELLAPLLAERLAPLLEGNSSAGAQLVNTRSAAAALGLSTDYLREHAEDLGAVRLGSGSRARLRFDLQLATNRLRELHSREPQPLQPTPKRRSGRVLTLRYDA